MATLKFPDGFLWGAATSSHQVEGNNHNDWSEWEKANAERLAREAQSKFGHLPHWNRIKAEAEDPKNYISGAAADHYNRFREDFDIAKSLGHNAHRFSIEWSRIEPEEGKFDEKEIEHYRDVLKALRERNIEPFVTLWHWTLPLWVSEHGGWENRDTVPAFSRYVAKAVEEFGDLIRFWMPLNEPGTYVGMSFIQGAFPPQKKLGLLAANRAFRNLMRAYREAYALIHNARPEALVGISHYAVYMFPYKNRFLNRILVKILDYVRNWRFLNSVNDTNDFIGIQYYHTDHIKFSPLFDGRWGLIDTKNPNQKVTDMGWDMYPQGLSYLLERASRYKKPIYITEYGIADARDALRERYIREGLTEVHRALQKGVDIRGFLYWSLLDNFEWDKGFWPRFGLVEVDYQTQERKIRESARMYAEICHTNALVADDSQT